MELTIGHVLYLTGCVMGPLLIGIAFLKVKDLNPFFEGYENPDKARKFCGWSCIIFLIIALIILIFNWEKVSPSGMIFLG